MSVYELLLEYKQTLKDLKKIEQPSEEEQKIVRRMIRDVEFVIKWLSTGRMPGSIRGVENLASYQREIPTDIFSFQNQFISHDHYPSLEEEETVEVTKTLSIEESLKECSDNERDVYLMRNRQYFKQIEIASILDVTRSTVNTNIKRAEDKINKQRMNLFSM